MREIVQPKMWTEVEPLRSRSASLHPKVTRSSTIAIATSASPAASAWPTCSPWSAARTRNPRPGYPTVAAITMMPSAIMIVWLTPTMIAGLASGSCTFRSS